MQHTVATRPSLVRVRVRVSIPTNQSPASTEIGLAPTVRNTNPNPNQATRPSLFADYSEVYPRVPTESPPRSSVAPAPVRLIASPPRPARAYQRRSWLQRCWFRRMLAPGPPFPKGLLRLMLTPRRVSGRPGASLPQDCLR